jgi:hypothetical protein
MNEIEKLVALEELRLLKARYFRYLDTKQWSAWSELFEPDIVADFRDESPDTVYRGREEFVNTVKGSLDPAVTLHHGHTPELEILSPTTAKGIWVMQDWLYWPEGGNKVGIPGIHSVLGWGHYHETYLKGSSGWRIATLRLTRIRKIVA